MDYSYMRAKLKVFSSWTQALNILHSLLAETGFASVVNVSALGSSLRISHWTCCYVTPLYRIYISNLRYSAGMFQALWLIDLVVFGALRVLVDFFWQIHSKSVGL